MYCQGEYIDGDNSVDVPRGMYNYRMSLIRQTWNWLVTSSADPLNYSSTAKGALKILLAEVVRWAATACSIGIAQACLAGNLDWANQAIEFFGVILYGFLLIFGGIQGLYGLYRKWQLGQWSSVDAPTA